MIKSCFVLVVLAVLCSTLQPSLFSQEKTKTTSPQETTGKKKEIIKKKTSGSKSNTKKNSSTSPLRRTTTRETGIAENDDRDPAVGKTPSGKIVFEGARGGHYYLTENQNKVYVQDFIGSKIIGKTHDGKNIYEGPRGGRFYYSDKGDKVYVKK